MNKLLSGKFIFTIVSAYVFAFLSIKGILPVDKVSEILLLVIYAYFTKNKENGGEQK